MAKLVKCRYCDEDFVPLPGKPGLVDECPDCLHEKTRAAVPLDLEDRIASATPGELENFRLAVKALVNFARISETQAKEIIAQELRRQGRIY